MIKFPSAVDGPSVQDIAIMSIMNDIHTLEDAGFKIIRIEANYTLKALLFPDDTFEDYLPRNAHYELGTLYTDDSYAETEYPKYRLVVEEVTEERYIKFGD